MRKDLGISQPSYSKSPPFKSSLLQERSKRATSLFCFEKRGWACRISFALLLLTIVFYFFFNPLSGSKTFSFEDEDERAFSSEQGDQALALRNEMLLEYVRMQSDTIKALEKLTFSLSSESTSAIARQMDQRLEQLFQNTLLAKVFWIDTKGHHLWLDRGALDAVHVGDSVSDGADLVGYVDAVLDHQARVHLITDPRLHVAVELRGCDVLPEEEEEGLEEQVLMDGLLHGPKGQLHNLERKVQLQGVDFASKGPFVHREKYLGALLRTSGVDERFPSGFPVARVVSYWQSPTGEEGLLAQSGFSLKKDQMLFVTAFKHKESAD